MSEKKEILLSVIQEYLLVESKKDRPSDISAAISRFKREIKNKRISCRISFLQPDPNNRFGDFGSLDISINLGCGRARHMTKGAVEKAVKILADKAGLLRFFSYSGWGQNGERLDFEFDLKERFVSDYVKGQELPIDVVDLDTKEVDDETIPLPKRIK